MSAVAQGNPFVLNFAPTGMVPGRKDNPHVPISPGEITEQVQEAVELGITVVHLHARDENEAPSHDIDLYADIIGRVRAFAPELVICVSLSGRLRPDFESRSAPLQLTGESKPDMGSLTLSSLNFSRQASMNAPEMIQRLAKAMLEKGIVPELEAFDGGMVNYALYLIKKGLVEAPYYFNLIFGNPFNAQADPLSLGAMLACLPQQSLWGAGGIGGAQTPSAAMGLAAGGGVRTGLEDNLFADSARSTLATNLGLLKRAHALAAQLERRVMSPAEFRGFMKMQSGNGAYGRAERL
mgnify:CR=1 FL=1